MRKEGFDICVVGGAGHVGAPLALVLASRGFRVLVHDLNQKALDLLASGELPFREAGGEKILQTLLPTGRLCFTSTPADVKGIPNLIITIGTPVGDDHQPVTQALVRCVDGLLPSIDEGACLILRSTVGPGCTDFLDRHLKSSGKDVLLAYCPERVVEGRAIEEIQSLTQIVSGTSAGAVKRARTIFEKVATEIVEMDPLEAEYAKLICNVHRYIQFAATNELYMLVEAAGLNYGGLLEKVKRGYPRMAQVPRAGFAGGPCLMKDTLQLAAVQGSNFSMGQIALTINEGLPNYLVEQLQKKVVLKDKRIGILGMAFKAESDDIRGSLSYRLNKLLHFQGAVVQCSDEYVTDASFVEKDELIEWAEILIIAVPHGAYKNLTIPDGKVVVDACHCL